MTHHQLLKTCGAGIVSINANVGLAGQQCFEEVSVWPVAAGCCFVWATAGGLHPWVFVACELETFWHISRFPGDWSDQVQLWMNVCVCVWDQHLTGTHCLRLHEKNICKFHSGCFLQSMPHRSFSPFLFFFKSMINLWCNNYVSNIQVFHISNNSK